MKMSIANASLVVILALCAPVLADTYNAAFWLKVVEGLPIPAMSFEVPADMTATNILGGMMAESESGRVFMAIASPTNYIAFEQTKRITLDGFRRTTNATTRIQKRVERPSNRNILGSMVSGIVATDEFHGVPRTTEIYIFPHQGCAVTVLIQWNDHEQMVAAPVLETLCKTLKMELPQQHH